MFRCLVECFHTQWYQRSLLLARSSTTGIRFRQLRLTRQEVVQHLTVSTNHLLGWITHPMLCPIGSSRGRLTENSVNRPWLVILLECIPTRKPTLQCFYRITAHRRRGSLVGFHSSGAPTSSCGSPSGSPGCAGSGSGSGCAGSGCPGSGCGSTGASTSFSCMFPPYGS